MFPGLPCHLQVEGSVTIARQIQRHGVGLQLQSSMLQNRILRWEEGQLLLTLTVLDSVKFLAYAPRALG